MTNLDQLLEQSKQLTTHIISPLHQPIARGLQQIEQQSKRLLKRTAQDEPIKMDNRAAFLLANKGFDDRKVTDALDRIDLSLTFEPLHGLPDTDIQGYLRNEHENIISSAIQEQKTRAVHDFEDRYHRKLQKDWVEAKQRIMQELGYQQQDMEMEVEEPKQLGEPTKRVQRHGKFTSNPRLAGYSAVVQSINDCRKAGRPFNPLNTFAATCEQLATDSQQQFMIRCWNLVIKMLSSRSQRLDPCYPGHFSKDYEQALEKNEQGSAFRLKMVHGARHWLEENYTLWVREHVRNQRYEIGGMPSVFDEVDAIISLRFKRNNRYIIPWLDHKIGKFPFWAHLYTLVRMGLKDQGLELIKRYAHEFENSKERMFPVYYEHWMNAEDSRLPKKERDQLLAEWNASIRDYVVDAKTPPKGDVFKYALYKIIGRCEVNIRTVRNNDVITSTEDYLWFNMMLLQENQVKTDAPTDRFTLFDFSSKMQQFGLAHFKTSATWFMVLLLCGEFELAVGELYKDPYFSLDAVHFAIALSYYGVLRVPQTPRTIASVQSLVSSEQVGTHKVHYFHYTRMITKFIQPWAQSEVIHVLPYIYTIGIYGAPLSEASDRQQQREYTQFVYGFLRDILKTCTDYSLVLGSVRADGGGRIPGSIETYKHLIHLKDDHEFVDQIVLVAAKDAEGDGRYRDSLQLYHLGFKYNSVLHLLSRRLGDTLAQHGMLYDAHHDKSKAVLQTSEGNLPLDADPVASAHAVLEFYKHRASAQLDPKTVGTCETLIAFARFKALIEAGQYEDGLTVFYQVDIFPTTSDFNAVTAKANAFGQVDELVARVVPQSVLLAGDTLLKLYELSKSGRQSMDKQPNEQRAKQLQDRFKALHLFLGSLQYRVSSEIYAKMNRIDVLIG
ncbi:Nup93/Nic96-domain-containing protein [Gorgonomyces haynaldii]|nr:Nup93/Nic96-domain-containing protein [Gorgonomyces haynaldii]